MFSKILREHIILFAKERKLKIIKCSLPVYFYIAIFRNFSGCNFRIFKMLNYQGSRMVFFSFAIKNENWIRYLTFVSLHFFSLFEIFSSAEKFFVRCDVGMKKKEKNFKLIMWKIVFFTFLYDCLFLPP